MYAVIKTGGKQYRVSQGDRLRVESLKADEGESIEFDHVLMISDGENVTIGNPLVSQAKVTGKVISHGRGKKITIIKFRRRKHHRKQAGHRQNYTELEIVSINGIRASSSPDSSLQQKVSKHNICSTDNDTTVASVSAPQFLDAPNGAPDDLKKILGIGSVLEEKLNGVGIFHYHQIAEFTDTDVDNINTHLSFPGRIQRDEWITQARELSQGYAGRTLKYLDGPDGEANDLKLIHGVGPVLENKLNELGIYHFWQIAKFEQKDIDLVNDALAFPGRIERDDWIEQSKNLATGGDPK